MAISKTAAKFRKTGDTLDHVPSEDVAAGAVVRACGLVCIALHAIPAGSHGALKVLRRGEVVELTTDEAIGETAGGTAVYVDDAGLATKASSGAALVGYTHSAVAAGDLSFEVVCA